MAIIPSFLNISPTSSCRQEYYSTYLKLDTIAKRNIVFYLQYKYKNICDFDFIFDATMGYYEIYKNACFEVIL